MVEIDKSALMTGWPSQKNKEWKKLLNLIFRVVPYDEIILKKEKDSEGNTVYSVQGIKSLSFRSVT